MGEVVRIEMGEVVRIEIGEGVRIERGENKEGGGGLRWGENRDE